MSRVVKVAGTKCREFFSRDFRDIKYPLSQLLPFAVQASTETFSGADKSMQRANFQQRTFCATFCLDVLTI